MAAAKATNQENHTIFSHEGSETLLDPVHGSMFFPEALVLIIYTTEFQRLRRIKQLGGTSLVFPGGIHTRFDHSLGTAYLSGNLLKSLREKEKDIEITDKNVLCVQIAGLCHDLGQGPFSRVYKHEYLGKLKQTEWNQCEAAVKIFDIILEKEKIKSVFKKYGICEEDIVFIKHAMTGKIPQNPKEHRFLYEIVKNKRNGVDCNMFDTILRDCYFVGIISGNFDYARYFLNISINKVNNEYRICTRYKEKFELRELFHTLWALQHKVYQHKTTVGIERMLAEALAEAEVVFPEIFTAREEPKKLLTLTDSIINRIMYTKDERLARAKEIIMRITERNLYQFCGQTSPKIFIKDTEKTAFCKEVASAIMSAKNIPDDVIVEQGDIFIDIVDIKYGIGNGDPIEKTDFVNKYGKLVTSKNQIIPEEESHPLKKPYDSPNSKQDGSARSSLDSDLIDNIEQPTTPTTQSSSPPRPLKNQYIRVYSRNEEKREKILAHFHSWCIERGCEVSIDMEKIPVEHEDSSTKSKAVRKLEFS